MHKFMRLKQKFRELVSLKYHLYNGLFLTLPFSGLANGGIELPLFINYCREQLSKKSSPEMIVDNFFYNELRLEKPIDHINMLFLFLQIIERQVVLFDALENAAFSSTHDMTGPGTLENFISNIEALSVVNNVARALETYRVRVVLTAHPTQFYPEPILGIIKDLSLAVETDNILEIENLLLQLGETPFRNLEKVTPLSEAEKLIHRCDNVFYDVLYTIHDNLYSCISPGKFEHISPVIELGFWPGGDRDGNPFVTVDTTLTVAQMLKSGIIRHYLHELEHLRHKLTFKGMEQFLNSIENKLQLTSQNKRAGYKNPSELIDQLLALKKYIEQEHRGLFSGLINRFILLTGIFGFHFGTLDVRQDSGVHSRTLQTLFNTLKTQLPDECQHYATLNSEEKLALIQTLLEKPPLSIPFKLDNPVYQDTLDVFEAISTIQKNNGEKGLNRYIISHTTEAWHVLEVFLLCHWTNSTLLPHLDIIPLFESIESLKRSAQIMQVLYRLPIYKKHLEQRQTIQIIMVGFSDGTKDGGYFTCNWEIFQCKHTVKKESDLHGIDVVFFDGRGGPPSRGGGSTHQFYSALGTQLPQREIQLTLQGQTISSDFGTQDAARFSLEQMFTAGLKNHLFPEQKGRLLDNDCQLLNQLSEISYQKYLSLKNHPDFLPYLEQITPLKYYDKVNVSSRPGSRESNKPLNLDNLRAIPFMGAWAQMKQNISGYFGLGTALKELSEQGCEEHLKELYQNCLFFRTILDNSMIALSKSYLPLTQYLENDPVFGDFWKIIQEETLLSKEKICQIAGIKNLLEHYPVNSQSIALREEMLLPLLVIQQYALIKHRKADLQKEDAGIYEKLIIKSLPPSINATRNAI